MTFTKRNLAIAGITVSGALAVTVSIAVAGAFAFCVFVVLTA